MATNTEELRLLIDTETPKTIDILETEQNEIAKTPKASTEEDVSLNLEKEIQIKLKILREDAEEDKLKKITITKEIFEQIRKSLEETVKSMEKNPSLFSRAADFWGELPLWQKIIGGVAITLPTLIIGIAAHVGFLLAICGVTAVTYTAGGIILDDHHKCSTSSVESLQKGILGLADLLELTINALNVIREQLEAEIAKFAHENQRLTENINALSQQIDAVDKQVRATSKINETLNITKEGLGNVANALTEGINQQSDLLKQAQEKLNRINDAYDTNQKDLGEKVAEIEKIKTQLGEDLNRAKSMIDALGNTISQLTNSVLGDEEQRKAFQEKLDLFIHDKESSFLQIADRICEAEKKLAVVQKELETANGRYQELLEIQGKHIDRLANLGTKPKANTSKEPSIVESLSKNGIYATPKKDKEITENEDQLTHSPN